MSQCAVSGVVTFENGEALLRLAPAGPAASANNASSAGTAATTSSPPWGAVRDDTAILTAIEEEKVKVHPSRLPMSADSLRIILNTVQRSLRLNVGMFGQWNLEANKKLIKILAKAKRLSKTPDGTNLLALEDKNKDKNEHLAIEDAKHDAKDGTKDTKDEDIDQDPAATDDIEMKGTNKRDDNGKRNDSSSSSSDSSSSSSSLEEEDMKKIVANTQTHTWTSDWADAWTSSLYVLESSGENAKKRRIASKMLLSLKKAKLEWDRS